MYHIYIHAQLSDSQKCKFVNTFDQDTIQFNNFQKPDLENVNIIVGNIPCDWLDKFEKLKLIQTDSAGFDNYLSLDWSNLAQKNILLGNMGNFYAIPVAEEAICAMFYFLRGIPQILELQTHKEWNAPELRSTKKNLTGKTVTILGYGNIGQAIDKMLQPFSCDIIPFRSDAMKQREKLTQAIEKSSILVSTIPYNKKNLNFLNFDMLEKLGPEGIFINVGRGGTVDEDAVIKLANSKKILGAYLDVTFQEPLPSSSLLWDMKNIILSQHSAGGSDQESDDKVDFLIEVIKYYKKYQKPMFPINILKYINKFG